LTVPVGLPAVPGATVAVKVTVWFRLVDVGAKLNVVLVLAFCTTWLNTADVLAVRVLFPA
jgi:hypothetical protein